MHELWCSLLAPISRGCYLFHTCNLSFVQVTLMASVLVFILQQLNVWALEVIIEDFLGGGYLR